MVQRPFSSDGQRAAATALDLGHGQQAELEEDLYRGSKIGEKNSLTKQIHRYIIQTATTEMFSCYQQIFISAFKGKIYNLGFYTSY